MTRAHLSCATHRSTSSISPWLQPGAPKSQPSSLHPNISQYLPLRSLLISQGGHSPVPELAGGPKRSSPRMSARHGQLPVGSHKPFKGAGNREAAVPCGHQTPPRAHRAQCAPQQDGAGQGKPQVPCSIQGTSWVRSPWPEDFPGWGHSLLQASRGTKGTLSLHSQPKQLCHPIRGALSSQNLLWVFLSSPGLSCSK